ncbi:MAG TPA: hypothetical protein PLR99_19950 [Polyangiaceae bacterium]|nr:hypothetical protein [Polyangiaceae bacterium]
MTARDKIEKLTNSWYGFALLSALWSLFQNGIGMFSLVGGAVSLAFSLALTYFIGKRLLARSSLTRSFLLVVSVLSMLLGTFWVYRTGVAFFHTWSFGLLLHIAFALMSLRMNFKSVRVLTDDSVAAYCR